MFIVKKVLVAVYATVVLCFPLSLMGLNAYS